MAQPAATGMSDRPIVVMTVPVTTGGKNFTMSANPGATIRPITEATSTDPKTAGRPSPPARMDVIVATPANETP